MSFFSCWSKEKKINISKWMSTWVAKGHMNRATNEIRTQSCRSFRVLLGAQIIWPSATYILWRKQPAGNIHVCKIEINNS